MKIIKMGRMPKRIGRRTCEYCHTIFEYGEEDIFTGHSGMDAKPCDWVICPVCSTQIGVEDRDDALK